MQELDFTVDQIGNGSKGLLDEVASSKITGEEDTWSHTDLWDFQANVDGARVGYETLKPLLQVKDPQLVTTLNQRFAALQDLLDKYKPQRATASSSTTRSPEPSARSSATRSTR